FNWLYARKAADFDAMTNLSKSFRQKLADTVRIGQLTLAEKAVSPASASIKYLFELDDKNVIESVFIPESGRRTLCISSQAGCALKCVFCATGQIGLRRNLTAGEIVEQVVFVEQDTGLEVSNIVFMGMGEPFKNYENVIKAADLIKHEDGIAVGSRRIVISTAGIVPAIYQYADEGHKFKLAVSLHSAINEEREKLMPISAKYTVEKLTEAVRYYIKQSGKRPTFEYVLLSGVNDTRRDAEALKKMVRNTPCKINLIPYNPVVEAYRRPDEERVNQFAQWLLPLRAPVSVRWSKGVDIDAACGQLAGKRLADVHKV
ncbi:23S rRNA (adenine(2503)-C(2))-methyltransferase, partial [candidate division KSB1 bacterium RBG_16_48_16]